jgi:hypothetical protein
MIGKQEQLYLARMLRSLPKKGETTTPKTEEQPPKTEESIVLDEKKSLPPNLAKDEFKKGDKAGNDKQDKGKKPFRFGKGKDKGGDDDKGKKGDTTVTCKISKESIDAMFVNMKKPEPAVAERWDTNYQTPKAKQGMFDGWSLARLRKADTNAHGTRAHQLAYAIRAKSGWGKTGVKKHD